MRIFAFLFLVTFILTGFSANCAADKATHWSFIYHKGYKHDFDPYVGQQKLKQRSEKDMDSWSPENWIENPDDEKIILRDFYALGIIKKQYIDENNIPVLRVGEAFIKLSDFDQKRILEFMDYIFEITQSEENGMFYIVYDGDNEPLGIYNKSGYLNY